MAANGKCGARAATCRRPAWARSQLDLVHSPWPVRALRLFVHALLRMYLRVFHGLRASDARRLRHVRGCLIVANHSSHLDALVLMSAFALRRVNAMHCVCAADYFYARPIKRTITFVLANAIAMDRTRVDARTIRRCRQRLADGANIVFFPEGTRSTDGRIHDFLGGIGLLALKYDLPIIPAAIRGAYECCCKGRLWPRPGRIEVAFGQPIRFRRRRHRKQDWLAVAADLQGRVRGLADELAARDRARRDRRRFRSQTPHARPAAGKGAHHECRPDQDAQAAGAHARPPQRRRPHCAQARVHLRKDGGLRLPEPAVGAGADRQGAGPDLSRQ